VFADEELERLRGFPEIVSRLSDLEDFAEEDQRRVPA
jgi:hypothetical protein